MIGILRKTRVSVVESENHFERLKAGGDLEENNKAVFIFRRRLPEQVEYLVLSVHEDDIPTRRREGWSSFRDGDEGEVHYELLTVMRTLQEDKP
jgi:hypothetical protein